MKRQAISDNSAILNAVSKISFGRRVSFGKRVGGLDRTQLSKKLLVRYIRKQNRTKLWSALQ